MHATARKEKQVHSLSCKESLSTFFENLDIADSIGSGLHDMIGLLLPKPIAQRSFLSNVSFFFSRRKCQPLEKSFGWDFFRGFIYRSKPFFNSPYFPSFNSSIRSYISEG